MLSIFEQFAAAAGTQFESQFVTVTTLINQALEADAMSISPGPPSKRSACSKVI